MKMPLVTRRNNHPSRSGKIDPTRVGRRDLIATTNTRMTALSEVQNLSLAKRFVASRWEDLNPLEVVRGLLATATRADLIETLREGRSKLRASTKVAREDTKAEKETQTGMGIRPTEAATTLGGRALKLALPVTIGLR